MHQGISVETLVDAFAIEDMSTDQLVSFAQALRKDLHVVKECANSRVEQGHPYAWVSVKTIVELEGKYWKVLNRLYELGAYAQVVDLT